VKAGQRADVYKKDDRIVVVQPYDFSRTLTRRSFLQQAAYFTAAAAFSKLAGAADQGISPAMEKLSTYMAEARNHALPDAVLLETKHHVLDTLAPWPPAQSCPRDAMLSNSLALTAARRSPQ
jgi:hypothetical protein